MIKADTVRAVAYMRTSSSTNVGEDKDSEQRQRAAIESYADRSNHEVVRWFYDVTKGETAIDERPAFMAMLAYLEASGVTVVIVETANRFARELMTQEIGYHQLRKSGIQLIAADSPNAFLDDGPTATLIRQVLGAVAQFEKASLVAKLRAARMRKKIKTGKCGGRKSLAELRPDAVSAAKGLRGSLGEISRQLAALGHVTPSGKAYARSAVKSMLNQGKGN